MRRFPSPVHCPNWAQYSRTFLPQLTVLKIKCGRKVLQLWRPEVKNLQKHTQLHCPLFRTFWISWQSKVLLTAKEVFHVSLTKRNRESFKTGELKSKIFEHKTIGNSSNNKNNNITMAQLQSTL